jgi:hypothetical protein
MSSEYMSSTIWNSLSIKEGRDAASQHHGRGNGWKALSTPSLSVGRKAKGLLLNFIVVMD